MVMRHHRMGRVAHRDKLPGVLNTLSSADPASVDPAQEGRRARGPGRSVSSLPDAPEFGQSVRAKTVEQAVTGLMAG
jgi:hypothetical protein